MTKPEFQNLRAELWVDPIRLGATQPTLSIFHNTKGHGEQIQQALKELSVETPPAQRVLTFVTPTRQNALKKMKLKLISACEKMKIMHVGVDHELATIEMSDVGLKLLIDAFTSWLSGYEDFGVAPNHSSIKPSEFGKLDKESGELWFWGPSYGGP